MPDTNTESELTAMWERFYGRTDRTKDAIHFALHELDITVVPDPNPEPEGDVIVVDQYAVCWRKGRDYWIDFASGERRPWSDLDGPVKIYRPSNTDEREALAQPSYWHQPTYEFLHRDAADAIEALEAEVEDLKKWWGRSVRATEKREQERDAYAAVIALALADSWPVKHDQTAHMRSALMQAPEDTLAARDRRVAAEALRSASSLPTDDDYVFRSTDDIRDWLRARADQIESP